MVIVMNDHPESAPLIEVSHFQKAYGRTPAVRDMDLVVRPGEIYGLIGPDGAGKSSLMKAIAGVLTYDAGLIRVFGLPVDSERSAEKIKPRIGFMPQGLGLNLYPELSVDENIDFFARLRLVPEDDLARRKDRLLTMTRLDPFRDRPMKNLSGGMKQKLGLICSLIHEPDLIILDEPTTGVDPVSRRDFWAILTFLLRQRGMTALVSTAYMEEATRFHRVSLMHEGRTLSQGDPDQVTARAPGIMASLTAEPPMAALARLTRRYGQVETLGNRFRVFLDNQNETTAPEHLTQTLSGLDVRDIHTMEPELEDVFVHLIQPPSAAPKNKNESLPDPALRSCGTVTKTPDGYAIEALDLVRDFGGFRAVDRVSFSLAYGEIFGLLGANGAGKTTVIKMLTGILSPSSGRGMVAGADMGRAGQEIRRRIGYMSQAFSLYTDLTVMENIRLYAGIYGLDRKTAAERARWVLDMAELAGHEKALAGSLPMGMRQRLALGCALVHRPQVLFLDEPTSGVDPLGRRRLWDTFYRLAREDKVAILVTTHYMSEAEHCDHLALMFDGRLVADAGPSAMKRDLEISAGSLLAIGTDQPYAAMDLLEAGGIEGAALYGKKIHLLSHDTEALIEKIKGLFKTKGLRMTSAARRPLSMEDVFVNRVLALEKEKKA